MSRKYIKYFFIILLILLSIINISRVGRIQQNIFEKKGEKLFDVEESAVFIEKTLDYINESYKAFGTVGANSDEGELILNKGKLAKDYRNIRTDLEKMKASLGDVNFKVNALLENTAKSIALPGYLNYAALIIAGILLITVFVTDDLEHLLHKKKRKSHRHVHAAHADHGVHAHDNAAPKKHESAIAENSNEQNDALKPREIKAVKKAVRKKAVKDDSAGEKPVEENAQPKVKKAPRKKITAE